MSERERNDGTDAIQGDALREVGAIPEGPAIPTARDFGVRLREARVAAGLSLRDAAELLGTSTVHLGRVERGVLARHSCAWCGLQHESWAPCPDPPAPTNPHPSEPRSER